MILDPYQDLILFKAQLYKNKQRIKIKKNLLRERKLIGKQIEKLKENLNKKFRGRLRMHLNSLKILKELKEIKENLFWKWENLLCRELEQLKHKNNRNNLFYLLKYTRIYKIKQLLLEKQKLFNRLYKTKLLPFYNQSHHL